MSETPDRPETAVDDVRRIRERFDGAGLSQHVRESNRRLEELREELSLVLVPPAPATQVRRDGTRG